ncbi:MAG: energy-coupling factor ABC transporter permease, partial [Verrucomicrobia bacterium]|nr:energy-coupling factor ABC transporter permease [Verrucomicrobiota bacterium]
MHIPDGFLDVKTSAATAALAAGALGLGLKQVRENLPPARVPLLGLAAAFVFAGQMLNFPIAGGTSGHMVGSVLAAVLLGPGAAMVALTAVLLVQCLVFADGGLLALGANVFNMGVIGAVLGWGIHRLAWRALGGHTLAAAVAAAAFAAWCATVLAAVCCAAELAASGTVAARVVFPAMAGVHALIGVGEAIITALVIAAVGRARPELLGVGVMGGNESGK